MLSPCYTRLFANPLRDWRAGSKIHSNLRRNGFIGNEADKSNCDCGWRLGLPDNNAGCTLAKIKLG